MINIHPELTGKQFCFEHLAFHWVQQFSVFTISKLGIVTPEAASEGSSLWSVKLCCTILHWNWWTNISSSGRLTRCLLWFLHSICVTRNKDEHIFPYWVLTMFSTTQSPSPILYHLNPNWYYSHFTEEKLRFWKFKWCRCVFCSIHFNPGVSGCGFVPLKLLHVLLLNVCLIVTVLSLG